MKPKNVTRKLFHLFIWSPLCHLEIRPTVNKRWENSWAYEIKLSSYGSLTLHDSKYFRLKRKKWEKKKLFPILPLLITHLQNPPRLRKPCLHSHHDKTQDAEIPSTHQNLNPKPPDDNSRRSLINLQNFSIQNLPFRNLLWKLWYPLHLDYVLEARSVDTLIATGTLPPPFRTWQEFDGQGASKFFWFSYFF